MEMENEIVPQIFPVEAHIMAAKKKPSNKLCILLTETRCDQGNHRISTFHGNHCSVWSARNVFGIKMDFPGKNNILN
jgi:hypothetical protein